MGKYVVAVIASPVTYPPVTSDRSLDTCASETAAEMYATIVASWFVLSMVLVVGDRECAGIVGLPAGRLSLFVFCVSI